MPWKIEERENEFCVIKEADGSVERCHPTREHAEQHRKALYANDKSVDLDDFRQRIRSAYDAQHQSGGKEDSGWVQSVLDDAIIVEREGKLFRYGYVVQKETGDIVFGEPAQVRKVESYVAVAVTDGSGISIPRIATKAGRRLAAPKMDELLALSKQLRDAQAALGQFLAWAQYADNSPLAGEMLSAWDGDVSTLAASVTKALSLPPMHLKAVKSTEKGTVIGGIMAPWGSPKHRDLHLDWFTPETDFFLDNYTKAPAMFQHGRDPKIGKSILGHRDDAKTTDDGLWVQDWISKSNRFWNVIQALLDAGKLYYSPGSVTRMIDKTPTNQVKAFPIIEDTITPTPAQYQLGLQAMSLDYAKSLYDRAGIAFEVPEALRERLGDSLTSEDDQEAQKAAALARLRIAKARLLTY